MEHSDYEEPDGAPSLRFKGVFYDTSRDKWRAQIQHKSVRYSSPKYDTIEEAESWYTSKIEELGLVSAKTNPLIPKGLLNEF